MAKKHHPDTSGTSGASSSRIFHDIAEARDTLTDTHKRKMYDFHKLGSYQRKQTTRKR